MPAYVFMWEYELEVGRCGPAAGGEQLWYFQAWGSSLYPWWGEDGFGSADEALAAALAWYGKRS